MSDDWCLIESDPGVFTELLEKLDCQSIEFSEIYSLEDPSWKEHVYGLIFLFQWEQKSTPKETVDCPPQLFFAQQVTTNACATQAILSVLLNTVPDDQLGSILTEFKHFTKDFDPQLKGVAVSGSEEIRGAHNSFGKAPSFLPTYDPSSKKGEAFHFVAFVPHQNKVYELDGLQNGPIEIGSFDEQQPQDWLPVACQALTDKMAQQGQSVKFNLMAVVQDKRIDLKKQLEVEPDNEMLQSQLQHEEEKRHTWSVENARRRHNYLPFVVKIFQELARTGKLEKHMEAAKAKKGNALLGIKKEGPVGGSN